MASAFGIFVSSFPAFLFGKIYCRNLEKKRKNLLFMIKRGGNSDTKLQRFNDEAMTGRQ